MHGRCAWQDGWPDGAPMMLQDRGGTVDSEGPDGVVFTIDDVEDQSIWVEKLSVPPQVDVLPAVAIGEAARSDEALDTLHGGVEPGGVVEAAGEEGKGLARELGLEISVPDLVDRLE